MNPLGADMQQMIDAAENARYCVSPNPIMPLLTERSTSAPYPYLYPTLLDSKPTCYLSHLGPHTLTLSLQNLQHVP